MLGNLRDSDGRPTGQVKVIAVLAVIGLVALSAPAIVWLVNWITDVLL